MDDLLVDGDAERAGEAPVALERGNRAPCPDLSLSESIQFHRRHAWRNRLPKNRQHFACDAASVQHTVELLRTLDRYAAAGYTRAHIALELPQHHWFYSGIHLETSILPLPTRRGKSSLPRRPQP